MIKMTMVKKVQMILMLKSQRRKRVCKYLYLNLFLINYLHILDKKKKGTSYAPREQDNSHLLNLGNWSAGDWK